MVAAAALCVAPAFPSTADAPHTRTAVTAAAPAHRTVLPGPTPSRTPTPSPTPAETTPVDLDRHAAPVQASRAALRVDELDDPAIVREVRAVEGVRRATVVRVGRLQAGGEALTVAAVAPRAYRPFAPQVVADTAGVWDRLDDGELAVTHEHAQRLGLELGARVRLGGPDGVGLRVGALATNGLPPIAEAIVDRATGRRLGLATAPASLLVAVDDGISPGAIASRVEEQLGLDVAVIPDPHAPAAPVAPAPAQGDTVWDRLAVCESSGDWHANTGNGYYGGVQFLPESWWLVGGTGMPHEATREEQIHRAELLQARQGWVAWPVCSVVTGLRPAPAAS